jgi:hypothetical protein
VYVPADPYACIGFCSVDAFPSPKSHDQLASVPSSVLASLNDTESPVAAYVKLALGVWFAADTVTDWL